jgi:hypothetical protein
MLCVYALSELCVLCVCSGCALCELCVCSGCALCAAWPCFRTWGPPGGPEAFRGTCAAGFPNLFMLLGPNTALGHNSVVYMIEAQVPCHAWEPDYNVVLRAHPPARRIRCSGPLHCGGKAVLFAPSLP